MAEAQVSDAHATRAIDAAEKHNGAALARIMEEVGSCGWPLLVERANARLNGGAGISLGPDARFILSDKLGDKEEEGTISLTNSPFSASYRDKRCERKR